MMSHDAAGVFLVGIYIDNWRGVSMTCRPSPSLSPQCTSQAAQAPILAVRWSVLSVALLV